MKVIHSKQEDSNQIMQQNMLASEMPLDMLQQNIWAIQEGGMILFVNEYAAKLLGYASPKEVVGRNIYEITRENLGSEEQVVQVRANDEKVLNDRKDMVFFEKVNIHGRVRSFLCNKKAVTIDGCKAVMGSSLEITDALKNTHSPHIFSQDSSTITSGLEKVYDGC